jgi:hypothetical protein
MLLWFRDGSARVAVRHNVQPSEPTPRMRLTLQIAWNIVRFHPGELLVSEAGVITKSQNPARIESAKGESQS